MSALPQAVQAAAARADELIEEQAKLAAAQQPAPVELVEDPPTDPPAPEDPPTDPPAPADPPPTTVDEALAAAEHKYKVLQGKYNAEVPRLTRQAQEQEQGLRDMRQQLTNTQTLLASLNQGNAAPQPNAGASAPTPPQRLVKDDEIREFGPDLYDFIQRAAKEAVDVQGLTQPLEQRLSLAEEAVQTTVNSQVREAEIKVHATLDAEAPKWREQNEDPEFLAWLEEVDPYTGARRGEILTQAYQNHDSSRVVAFFNGFLNENAAITPQPPAPAPADDLLNPDPAPPEGLPLEGLIAPGTPKSGSDGGAPNEAGKRVWNRPQVVALYAKINEFTKKGTPAPKALQELEADLIRAQGEGRIQA
ncbi:MAG: hypothetical protein KAJ55_08995 [Anaerolineales bacterium]|nr:hypothetical protein [Anaerolineales bacterium]